jgi:hypothetical protein
MMRAIVSALLLLLIAPAPAYARRYAVIIGNDEGRSDDRPLKYAQRDAERFAAVLRKLGSVAPQDSVVLLGEPASSVRQAILDVNARIRAEETYGEDSTLIVYYSGHADAEGLHPGDSALPYQELRAMVAGSAARVRVLILDACRSGGLTNVKGGHPAPEFELAIEDAGTGMEGLVLMSSSAASEDSHESERLGASFFSHHLTNALLGAGDRNRDARVTLTEAYGYAYHQTLRASGKTASLQHPTYAYEVKGRGELVITHLENERTKMGSVVFAQPGTYLVLHEEDEGEVVAEVHVDDQGTRFALAPDRYLIQQRQREHYREYEVDVRSGEAISLARIEPRVVAYARLVRKGTDERIAAHGAFVFLNVRGPVLRDMGPAAGITAAYALDLEWASFQLRARDAQHRSCRFRRGRRITRGARARFGRPALLRSALVQRRARVARRRCTSPTIIRDLRRRAVAIGIRRSVRCDRDDRTRSDRSNGAQDRRRPGDARVSARRRRKRNGRRADDGDAADRLARSRFRMAILMRRWIVFSLLVSCGDPLVDAEYRGEPLYRFRGIINDYRFEDRGGLENYRASIFWTPNGDTFTPPAAMIEQRTVAVANVFPPDVEIIVFNPPDAETIATATTSYLVGMVLLYEDQDRDGRFTDGELRGGAPANVLIYANQPLSRELSPTGKELPAGYSLHPTPLPCHAIAPVAAARLEENCGVPLGAPCMNSEECGAGVCGDWVTPNQCVIDYEASECVPVQGAYIPAVEVDGMSYAAESWHLACDSDDDCPAGHNLVCGAYFLTNRQGGLVGACVEPIPPSSTPIEIAEDFRCFVAPLCGANDFVSLSNCP